MAVFLYPPAAAAAGGATEVTLDAVLTQVQEINAKVGGSLTPVEYDETVITYVGATTKIDTVVYKLATATVKTLTMSYDGSDRLTGVVAS